MVQQIRHDHHQRRVAQLGVVVTDSGCQVRLAAAVRTDEYQPTLWVAGKIPGGFKRVFKRGAVRGGYGFIAAQAEALKGFTRVQIQAGKFGVTDVINRVAVVGRQDFDAGDHFGVHQAGADSTVKAAQRIVAGNHRCQVVDITIIEDLEHFFLRPGCGVLRAKIVQYQEGYIPNPFKAFFKRIRAAFGISETQPIQQVGHG